MIIAKYTFEQLEAASPSTEPYKVRRSKHELIFEQPGPHIAPSHGLEWAYELAAGIELPPLDVAKLTAAVTAVPAQGFYTVGFGEAAQRVSYELSTYDGFLKAALLPAAYEIARRPELEGFFVDHFHTLAAKGVNGPYRRHQGIGAENEGKLLAEVERIRRGLGRDDHPTSYRWISMATEAGWDGRSAHSCSDIADSVGETVHGIRATPFRAFDPTTIPMRRSILRHYYLKFVSTTVAPGGVGKSTLCLLEAISIATGRNLTGTAPGERLKVWYINGEDPIDEIHRRVAAICIHHGIDQRELEGWLFLTSGRDMEIVLVEQARDGTKIHQHVVQQLKGTVRENDIAVVIFDPFVSCHRVSENDNNAMDRVVKLWAQIADQTGCAVELVHHARKTGGNDVTVEDGRGASAVIAAARSARVLNHMSQAEADKLGIVNRREYFRDENGKANLSPPSAEVRWFHLASVRLGNGGDLDGDSVGVAVPWKWPELSASVTEADFAAIQALVKGGSWRANPQAADWVGYAIATALGLDLDQPRDKARAKEIQRQMNLRKLLIQVERKDGRREVRKFVEVGEPAAA